MTIIRGSFIERNYVVQTGLNTLCVIGRQKEAIEKEESIKEIAKFNYKNSTIAVGE